MRITAFAGLMAAGAAFAAGPVTATRDAGGITVAWQDERDRAWTARFSLDPAAPLITAISRDGAEVVRRARPFYQCSVGKRRGGWDEFFDFPPSHPEGTRSFQAEFKTSTAKVVTIGNRLEVVFDSFRMGPFHGTLRYRFFPGSRLIEQAAVLSTDEPDTAYFYDAGVRAANLDSQVSFYDTRGQFREVASQGPERHPEAVRYRVIAARTGQGSLAVFPAPHRYFFTRDFTSNMGYVWHHAWRGQEGMGIRQLPDDSTAFYPWSNAPPGTEQRMSMWMLVGGGSPREVIDDVLRYTNADRLPELPGYRRITSHWHFGYTVQAMEKGLDWLPPFKPVLKDMGVDGAIIMDFHGDGHPRDLGELRSKELRAFYDACRAQSGKDFLLIPGEEANVHFGGHWALSFPKPVIWYMNRRDGEPVKSADGVWRVKNAEELLELVRAENGFVYQTHPRTKGSKGFPDQIRESAHFRDDHFFGAGWKALPSDLSSPRLGERAFKLLDDMAAWGMRKRLIAEVDVFQIDPTHELWAHMNVNYVRMPELPAFDDYGRVLDALRRGEFFVSTGEVLLPEWKMEGGTVRAKVRHTFPLEMAEVIWDGGRRQLDLQSTASFGEYALSVDLPPEWKWARLAVWDAVGNGAFTNPVWK